VGRARNAAWQLPRFAVARPRLMQCLVPFEPRDAGPRGATASRLPWFVAVATCGAALGILALFNWRELADTLHRHAVLQAELGVCGGTLIGLLVARMEVGPLMRRRLAILDRLYEAAAASPVPVQAGYTHYLPCVLLFTDTEDSNVAARMRHGSEMAALKSAIGGLLYVGPAGMQFQESGANHPTPPEAPQEGIGPGRTLHMGSVRQIAAAPVALPQGWVTRTTRVRPRYAMLVRWPAGQAVLAVPSIGDTLPRLHDCLDDLKWGTRAGSPARA
jgi:hypothetical protein